jgi:hypothetical protein
MTAIDDAYRKYSRERFPLPTEEQLADLERGIEIVFPDDYRQFILHFNGGYFCEPEITPVGDGCPQDALTFLSGIGASRDFAELREFSAINLFDDNNPPKIVPIGYTTMGGLIILNTAPGEGRGEIYYKQAFGVFSRLPKALKTSSRYCASQGSSMNDCHRRHQRLSRIA